MMVAIENFICSLVKMSARYILANTDIIKNIRNTLVYGIADVSFILIGF